MDPFCVICICSSTKFTNLLTAAILCTFAFDRSFIGFCALTLAPRDVPLSQIQRGPGFFNIRFSSVQDGHEALRR